MGQLLWHTIVTEQTHSTPDTERRIMMNYSIKTVFDHVEVYDMNGRFLFSADTQQEAYEELKQTEQAA